MELLEIPPLPFEPAVEAASKWLDRLPAGNPVEASRVLFPVLYSLRLHPLQPRRRFELLEAFQPVVFSLVHALALRIIHKSRPLEGAQRKLADYCYRFHKEMADCYRDLVRSKSFIPVFYRHERAAILSRALEHLGHALFRMAQIYEMPTAALWPRVAELYRYAETQALLDEPVAEVAGTLEPPRAVYQRILLFGLAAPGRADPMAMQCLFDRLAAQVGTAEGGDSYEAGRVVFRFDPLRPGIAVPALTHAPPERGAHFAMAGSLLDGAAVDLFGAEFANSEGLRRALPRLGRPVPCRAEIPEKQVEFMTGFKAVAMTLRFVEACGNQGGGMDYWPRLYRVEFAPLGEAGSDESGAPAAGAGSMGAGVDVDRSMANIVPLELPGYWLLETGLENLRAGHLLGLRDGDAWIRLAAVRAGQSYGGRFWHSVEVLGTFPRLVTVRGEDVADGFRTGFVLDDRANQGGISLVVSPVYWTCGQRISVDWFRRREFLRIGRLLELNADFCHFVLIEDGSDAADSG